MDLVSSNEAFFFKDFELDGSVYRIFNYRLASYTDFLQPSALECRGVMFQVSAGKNDTPVVPIRLASLPMEKFFNLYENPMTMDLDLSKIVEFEVKADGSLMSTYWHNGELRLKSKFSLSSDQCLAAMEWLDRPENEEIKLHLRIATSSGVTVNMEWTSPEHRVVLGYEKPSLTVLNARSLEDGSYWNASEFSSHWDGHVINTIDLEDMSNEEYIEYLQTLTGLEGVVALFENGMRVKIKTPWYLALHHTKDSINSPRRLFEAVLEEATDDMRSMFHDDPQAIQMIEDMEHYVDEKYNHMVDAVERYYERNKDLIRKDYAIKAKDELDKMYFGLAMKKYVGKEVDYKGFLKKKWRELGIRDKRKEDEEE